MATVTLYHHPLTVCSMKVRLALEEKELEWVSREVDIVEQQEQLEPWYIRLNPNGVVPTLEYRNGDSTIVNDSAIIIRNVAALTEGKLMRPLDEESHHIMEDLIDKADRINLQILSYARHPSMEKSGKILDARIDKARAMALQYPELRERYEICAQRSERNRELRVKPEHVRSIEKGIVAALEIIEERLEQSQFLIGDAYTLADVIWTVVLSRLELLDYSDWISGASFPRTAAYYTEMKNRPSFKSAQIQNQWWAK